MDEPTKNTSRARREGTRSRTRQAPATPIRMDAPLPRRSAPSHYGCAPMKDLKSRIFTFSIAIIVSLAAWGGFAYVAMHLFKK